MRQAAFTLMELLVTVAMIGLLVALLLPAVQQARAAVARVQCANNMRQIGLALHQFHDAYGVFPAASWTQAEITNPAGKHVGWRAVILPFLEQANLQAAYRFDEDWWSPANLQIGAQTVKIYQCPTTPFRPLVVSAVAHAPRPAMTFPQPLGPTDYEAIMGVQAIVDSNLYATAAANRSVMFRNSSTKMAGIADGTSQTIMVVECAARPRVYFRGRMSPAHVNDQGQSWVDNEGAFSLDGSTHDGLLQGQGPTISPHALNATNFNEPYSFHSGGANHLFADGHLSFIRENVPLLTFAALVTRCGGEVVGAAP